VVVDVPSLPPQVSWGTNPGQVVPVTGAVPEPRNESDERALAYMDLRPGTPVEDIRITVREPVAVTGQVRADGGRRLPAGLSVTLVPETLRPSALYPAETGPVGEDGRFALHSEQGTQALAIQGLPEGWRMLRINGEPRRAVIHIGAGPVEPVDVVVGPQPKGP